MIPRRYIEEWKTVAPWPNDAQVEQDLVIARALVEIFSDDLLKKSLAFRGGTALHKLYLQPQVRYSEDIDLMQINSVPINPILKQIREQLAFLGTKRTVKQHIHNNTVVYRFDTSTQPVIKMRLKIEINTREVYRVLLTRARQGMIIVVPNGDTEDLTRKPEYYDATFNYLKSLGIPVIN